jgi:hypothetical protein
MLRDRSNGQKYSFHDEMMARMPSEAREKMCE